MIPGLRSAPIDRHPRGLEVGCVKAKAATVPALVKICGAFKKVSDKLPAEAKQFEDACP